MIYIHGCGHYKEFKTFRSAVQYLKKRYLNNNLVRLYKNGRCYQ